MSDFKVQVVGITAFVPPDGVPWLADVGGGQALAEFAGRACYQSWDKPNPKTATNETYLRHILEVGHLSVLEHGSVTFYFTGVSRSFTHELIRHRHFSYSQLSQRYVASVGERVMPDLIAGDMEARQIFAAVSEDIDTAYEKLARRLEHALAEEQGMAAGTARRKLARGAARAVLPNAEETRIVVTGNYRAWRHFIAMRATEHADVEICAVAVEVLRQLQSVAPNVFGDFVVSTLDDGREVAASPYSHVGG